MWGRIGLLTLAGLMAISATVIGAPALADDAPIAANVTDVPTAPTLPSGPESTPQDLPEAEPDATPAPESLIEPAVATVGPAAAETPATTNAVLRGAPSGIVVMAAISGLSFSPIDPLPGGFITVTGNGCDPSENVLITTFSTSLGDGTYFDVIEPADATGSFSIATRVWGAPGDPIGAAGGEQIGVAAYCGGVETTDPARRQIVFGTMATPVGGPVPPVANPDTAHTPFGTPVTIGVLDNDTGDGLHVVGGTNGTHGDVVWAADGLSMTYTPNVGFSGTDTFGYSIMSSANLQSISTVTVTVDPPPPPGPPTAVADNYSTPYETPLVVASPGVLTNDTDPNGDSITALFGTSPAHGGLAFFPDGSFTYTPNPGFTGTDTFEYFGSDGTLSGARTTVTITVGAPADTGPGTTPSDDEATDTGDADLPDTGAGSRWTALIALILLGAGSVALRFGRIRT